MLAITIGGAKCRQAPACFRFVVVGGEGGDAVVVVVVVVVVVYSCFLASSVVTYTNVGKLSVCLSDVLWYGC